MTRSGHVLAVVLLTGGLITACGGSSDSSTTVTVTASSTATSASASPSASASAATATTTAASSSSTGVSADLPSLIPTPANSQRTDGPDTNQNGIRIHFVVGGAPMDVMNAYKTALEGKGWTVSVDRSGGGGGGGGATYSGTNGGAFGVFTGGGYGSTTDVNACAWPAKPSDTHCG